MGEIFYRTGISTRIFDALDRLMGRVRGRLAYLTVAGGTVFATLSGSSMANTAMLGTTLLPEMQRRGYRNHLSMGPIVACGGLAIIIPPSALAVLLGSLARIDIGQLLVAGLVPGLLLAIMYALVIFVSIRIDPSSAPGYFVEPTPWLEKLRLICINLLPMGFVIFMVVGLIVLGVATPTESAAFGVLGVVIIAAAFRRLTVDLMIQAVVGTVKITGMVFMIILASTTFSQLLALSGSSSGLMSWATSLDMSPLAILAAMFLVLVFFGMFMESVSIMMLTVPVFFPLALSSGFDPIWFGIVMLISLEIGLVTPPFGMGLFILLGIAPRGTTLVSVSLAALPYVLSTVLLVALLVLFPQITSLLRFG